MCNARTGATLFVATVALVTASAQQLPPTIALVGANVINVRDGSILRGVTIVVRNGLVESVNRRDASPGSSIINLNGHYVVPGLIDAHAHIADRDASVRALESGATTIRSAGVSAYTDVDLRELAKTSVLPAVIAAGYGLRPQLPADAFLSSPEYRDLETALHGTDGIRRAVRMNAGRRVDWIKIFATEGLATDPQKALFTEAEIRAVVEEASRHNIRVQAHAFGDAATAAAVRAGVRSIEHGSYASETTLRLMRDKRAFLVPTLRILTVTPDSAPATVRSRVAETLPRARQAIRLAHRIGVKVVAGTDSRYLLGTERFVSHEVMELAALGFTPLQAIQSATIVSAEMLQLPKVGAVEPQYEADLIAVTDNPLVDVETLTKPLFVMTNGRIALNKLPANP